jgi:hypothetical protein
MKRWFILSWVFTATLLLCIEGTAKERCEVSKAGIKRCEQLFHNPDGAMPDWKTITYFDHARDMIDFEADFHRDTKILHPAILIGATMAILNPKSTAEERGALFERLLANALKENFELIPFGRYMWTSGKMGPTIIVRASRKK